MIKREFIVPMVYLNISKIWAITKQAYVCEAAYVPGQNESGIFLSLISQSTYKIHEIGEGICCVIKSIMICTSDSDDI